MVAGASTHGNHITLAYSRWGELGCILCREADKYGESKFCFPCEKVLKNVGPILVRVPEDNETYNNGA